MSGSKQTSFHPIERPSFVTPLAEKHLCTKCNQALLIPLQTNCGHRYCKLCFEELKLREDPPKCVGLDPDCEDMVMDQVGVQSQALMYQRIEHIMLI